MSEESILTPGELPHEVLKLTNVVIPMPDGCKLRAHIWIPKSIWEDQPSTKIGTLVEYIPYRKNEGTAVGDSVRHPYYAGNGLASIRVDMRGSGDSDDVLHDEYLQQEQDDALSVFDWIVEQKWSNGNIAMFGKSWGGFNSLQIAARGHPALKTCISLMSTDNRYSDDVHYRGGCLLASDMLWWGSVMAAYNVRPQDPVVVGESWRENWFKRLNVEPMVNHWIEHQSRDSYWKHGSICEDYSNVDIPVLCIGGWRDGYTSPVFRMAQNLPHPESCGLVGPWVHEFPEVASPSPKIGYQQLSLRWFKKWLEMEEVETKLMPKLTAFVQEPSTIAESYNGRTGNWVSLSDPKELSEPKNQTILHLGSDGVFAKKVPSELNTPVSGTLAHGQFRGTWCPFGVRGDYPADQRYEDSKCECWDTAEMGEDAVFLGEPQVSLTLSSSKPKAAVSVRLVDIYPDNGEHVLLSWGLFNLTHRDSHEKPALLEPETVYSVTFPMDVMGVKIAKGHKLRVCVSACDWPSMWPSPETPTLTIRSGSISIPTLGTGISQDKPPKFEAASRMETMPVTIERPEERHKTTVYDHVSDTWTQTDVKDGGRKFFPEQGGGSSGLYTEEVDESLWKINPYDPLSAYNECNYVCKLGRRNTDWNVEVRARSILTCDENSFTTVITIDATENDNAIFHRVWQRSFPREFI